METAVTLERRERANLEIGICDEHGFNELLPPHRTRLCQLFPVPSAHRQTGGGAGGVEECVKDFLDVVPENDLEFQLNDPKSVILLAAAAQPQAFQYVCMPIITPSAL